MTNLVDGGRANWAALHVAMSRPVQYEPVGGGPAFELYAFLRGLRADDLFGSALQSDVVAIVNAETFAALLPARPRPLRYDRLQPGPAGVRFAVEEWRGSPHDAAPVFFKLLLRGGDQ